jgi:hypothetical protein
VVISEQGFAGLDFTLRRAQWEVARRYGRSQAVTLVADSWRDAAGKLWEPNTLAPVDLPELRLPGLLWLITQVGFVVDPPPPLQVEGPDLWPWRPLRVDRAMGEAPALWFRNADMVVEGSNGPVVAAPTGHPPDR